MRQIFVLVPSLHPAGPVKGAIALVNALAERRQVTLVAVKPGPGADAWLDERARLLELSVGGDSGSRLERLIAALEGAGGRQRASMISFCLSADFMALFARRHARWISSVRGNLPQNYRLDYGRIGPLVAGGHLFALRLADRVVAMTNSMAAQITDYTGRQPAIVGNFVDEPTLERWRRAPLKDGPLTFVFVGSLSVRKQPLVLLRAMQELHRQAEPIHLHLIGDGPLRDAVAETIRAKGLERKVTLHGQLPEPYGLLAAADALVLPSISEGVSRAVLESLQLGVPVVLRDIDGNREIIEERSNGLLFSNEGQLPTAMLTAARLRRTQPDSRSLLPAAFRQEACANKFLELAEAE